MDEAKERFSYMPLIMVGLGLILMGAAVYYLTRATRQVTPVPTATAAAVAVPDLPYSDIKRTSLEDAKRAFDQKKATFIDARGEPYFSEGHIPGAIPLTQADVPGKVPALDAQTWIITYCT
jgi:hypothetical protein